MFGVLCVGRRGRRGGRPRGSGTERGGSAGGVDQLTEQLDDVGALVEPGLDQQTWAAEPLGRPDLHLVGEQHRGDGEVGLQDRLVPDGEQDLAPQRLLVDAAVKAHGGEPCVGLRSSDGVAGSERCIGAEGEDGADAAFAEPPREDLNCAFPVFSVIDRENLDRAALVGGLQAVAALAEADVAGFVDDAEDVSADLVAG